MRLDGLDAVASEVGAVAHLLQQTQCQLLVHHVVLGQQDAQRVALSPCAASIFGLAARGARRRRAATTSSVTSVSNSWLRCSGFASVAANSPLVVVLAPAERGEQHQRQRGARPRGSRAASCAAVHARHVHVEDGQVEALACCSSCSAVCGRFGVARPPCPTWRPAAPGCAGWWRCRRPPAGACPSARAARR